MAPKVKFTREEIIVAALGIIRERGAAALTARSLAAVLGASAKPIFGQFKNMDEVMSEALTAANALYNSYIECDMKAGQYPPYKASGMAYIRFAKEECELFKLLFMRDRTGEKITDGREALRPILSIIMKNLGIGEDEAYLLHLELWVYVHGIATMIATSYLNWDMEFISASLTDVYLGLRAKYIKEENADGSN